MMCPFFNVLPHLHCLQRKLWEHPELGSAASCQSACANDALEPSKAAFSPLLSARRAETPGGPVLLRPLRISSYVATLRGASTHLCAVGGSAPVCSASRMTEGSPLTDGRRDSCLTEAERGETSGSVWRVINAAENWMHLFK